MVIRDENNSFDRNYHSIQVGNNEPPLANPECIRVDLKSAARMCTNALTGTRLVVMGALGKYMNFYEIMAWSEYFVH